MSPGFRNPIHSPVMVLFLLLVIPVSANAQTAFGIRWFGEPRSPSPPRTLAIGGVSSVAPWGSEPAAVGAGNPALNSFAERVLYSFTWEVGSLAGSYGGEQGTLWQTGPRMIGLVLPLGRGVAFSADLKSLTFNEFEVHSESVDPEGTGLVYHNYLGSGGLSKGSFSLAWRLPSGAAALGVSADLLFGAIKHEWAVNFDSAGYVDTRDRLQRQHRGNRLTAGVQLQPLPSLRLGAWYSNRGELRVDHLFSAVGSEQDTSSGRLRMGETVVVGAGLSLSDRWAVYLDYRRVGWDRAEWLEEPVPVTGSLAGLADIGLLKADADIGFGAERRMPPVDQQARFIDTLPLRFGLRTGAFYAPDLGGGTVERWYGTLGTAFDIGREGRTWADLTLQFGRYSASGGAHEFFWRVQIGITGAERWFQPPQR
jgi:hypothetical protein